MGNRTTESKKRSNRAMPIVACPLCRGPIKTWGKVTRVAGKGWCHTSCVTARREASTT
jgi:hypothetical protein